MHIRGVTSYAVMSGITSADVTLPSPLTRTHASILPPLPIPRLYPWQKVFAGCCQPLLGRTFPVLSLRIFLCVLGPIPRLLLWCSFPFLPTEHRPSRTIEPVGAWRKSYYSNFQYEADFGAAVILLCSGPQICLPPKLLLPRCLPTLSSHGVYIRAYHSLLPPCAPDMLTV